MPTDLAELNAALEYRYTVEREIGRGATARVFLARELHHNRYVALKVLHPELTNSIAAERFLQEIRTAAQLTHPNILPIHDSGRAGTLLYYVTPYVAGETLRARLEQELRIPLGEAITIADQIAGALAYAHEHDVVHRDIKPENILLTNKTEVWIADFGLARALTRAADQRITPTGVSVGSPLYISPEQAEGSARVDGRADIYSLGCVLYEMLTGAPPFTGASVRTVMHKHVTATPAPVTELNREVPAYIAAAVTKALEKSRARRFQNAHDFRRALSREYAQTGAHGGWRRYIAAGIAVAAIGGIAAVFFATKRNPGLPAGSRQQVILAEFESPTGDSLLARAVTEAIRIDFMRSRVLRPVDTRTVQLAGVGANGSARIDEALARMIAERHGVAAVLFGNVNRVGTGYILTAQIQNVRSGEALAAARVRAGNSSAVIDAIDELSATLREEMGERLRLLRAEKPLADVTTRSVEALRKYTLAVDAINIDQDQDAGIALLREAIRIDSSFAMAYRKLAVALENSGGQLGAAINAYEKAYRHRDRLTDREKYLAEAAYYDVLEKRTEAITAYEQLLRLYPDDVNALNNLGLLHAAFGNYERARELYQQALRSDSTFSVAVGNLINATFNSGDTAQARGLLERYLARDSLNPRLVFVRSQMNTAVGNYNAARASTETLLKHHASSAFWAPVAHGQLGAIAVLQRDQAAAEMHFREANRIEASSALGEALRISAVFARSQLLSGDRVRAHTYVDRALQQYPLQSIPVQDRPLVELAGVFADLGNVERARELQRLLRSDADPRLAARLQRESQRIDVAIALATRNARVALDTLRTLRIPACPICTLPEIGRAHELLGAPDSAALVYRRYLATPYIDRLESDMVWKRYVLSRINALDGNEP